jgi:uncharacterized cupredoxin-like copper-binding protein
VERRQRPSCRRRRNAHHHQADRRGRIADADPRDVSNHDEEDMRIPKFRLLLPVAAMIAAGTLASPLQAASTTVTVLLSDKGANVDMPTNMGMNMGAMDMSMATMRIKASPPKAKAGEITFVVKNISKDTIHEMILARLEDPSKQEPYIANESRVDEDNAGDLGEVSELDPGASGKLTVTLKPGKYLLYCNVPGHYMAGMWTTFTVE